MRRQAFGPARRLGRQLRRDLAGPHAAHHRVLGDALAVVRDPVDQLVAQAAELVRCPCPALLSCGPAAPPAAGPLAFPAAQSTGIATPPAY